ncbi:hypothetical protein SRHO_G00187700 [Serrasalmus rhombeus]
MTWHFSIAESKNQTGKFAQGLRLRQVDMLQEGITRSSATLSKLASKLRKVCKSAMKRMRRAKKQKIGSPREVVMIDESKFGHKRKYSQGRSSNRKSWVFGMLGVQAHERRPVLRIVKRRSKRHLMPILKNYYKTYKIGNGNGGFLPFVMNDIMGLEKKDFKDFQRVQTADVISALLGHVKEGYEFNPVTPLKKGDSNYVSNPSPDDKVHCLVTVVSANSLSLMDQSVINKMKTVKERANGIDIPQIVLLTKIDEVCPLVKQDLKKTYTSKKIQEKITECSNVIGAPVKSIFPVKNYCYESDTNDPTDILIMLALRHIISAANDYVASL